MCTFLILCCLIFNDAKFLISGNGIKQKMFIPPLGFAGYHFFYAPDEQQELEQLGNLQEIVVGQPEWRSIHLEPAPQALYQRYQRFYTRESIDASGNRIQIQGKDPIIKVEQSEIVFSSPDVRLIASLGAGCCVVLVVRERTTGCGFLAHIDLPLGILPMTPQGSHILNKCISVLNNVHNPKVDIYMVGGYSLLSDLTIGAIHGFVQKLNESVKVETVSQRLNRNWVSNVVFDFYSGEIYEYEEKYDNSPKRSVWDVYHNIPASALMMGYLSECEPQPRKIRDGLYRW